MKDVYIWAYERSCQQYVAVQQQLVPLDIVRLRYRNELAEVIRAIIRDGLATDVAAILAGTPNSVSQEDKQKFIILVQNELKTLHAGNAIRFGLRPLEFSVWQEKRTKFCD